nr:immunoglobulin heavy chain junction region [Macaca mulatta]MOV45762.1 immunoglobulin heavy chain junction region [Macaca mulatta]
CARERGYRGSWRAEYFDLW